MPTSTDGAPAVPPLPVLSVLFAGFGSGSVALTVVALSNAPEATIVAVTLIVTFAPTASEAMVHGRAAQAPVTLVMVRLVGVSVTWMLVAVDGPALVMRSENVTDWPALYGPAVVNVLTIERSAAVVATPPLPTLSVLFA